MLNVKLLFSILWVISCIYHIFLSRYKFFKLIMSYVTDIISSMSSSSRYRDSGNPDCKIYVGDLGSSASKQDLEDAFSYYGSIRNVWVARNPPGFAFVEFEDPRDAEDAVRGLDGR